LACWAIGAAVAVFGLWLWLGSPPISWYESYLAQSNKWLLVFGLGGGFFAMPLYGILILRGRLRQLD
jgi:hypothetical protein